MLLKRSLTIGLGAAIGFGLLHFAACSTSGSGQTGGLANRCKDDPRGCAIDGGDAGDAASGFSDASQMSSGFTSGWQRVAWAPECSLYQPVEQSAWNAIPPMHWGACPDGLAGCEELTVDWNGALGPGNATQTFNLSVGHGDDGSALLSFYRNYAGSQVEAIAWSASNGYVGAWRQTGETKCSQTRTDVSFGQFSMMANIVVEDGGLSTYKQVVGSVSEVLKKTIPDYQFDSAAFGSGTLEESSATTKLVKYRFGEVEAEFYRGRTATSVSTLSDGGATSPAIQYSQLVGDTVYAVVPPNIVTWTLGGSAKTLVEAPVGAVEHGFATDGTTMVWVESSNLDSNNIFQTNKVYSSPLSADSSGVVPTQILSNIENACSAGYCTPHVSEGYLTIQEYDEATNQADIVLVRLSDTAYWRLRSSASLHEAWGEGWVVGGEWWHEVTYYGLGTVQRVALSALGTPSTD